MLQYFSEKKQLSYKKYAVHTENMIYFGLYWVKL